MKNLLEITLIATLTFTVGYLSGRKPSLFKREWQPKVGDAVVTSLQLDGTVGEWRVVTITNVVRVGKHSQTGLLVYGDGLPGVDSSWVKPAP